MSQDHKRLLEGDTGPNTGGMGAYSPVAIATPAILDRARREVLYPALTEMVRRGTPFTGVLYAGLMVDDQGTPWVVEFNCRLGRSRDASGAAARLCRAHGRALAGCSGRGCRADSRRAGEASVTTVLASRGYPDHPEKGAAITIPDSFLRASPSSTRGPRGAPTAYSARAVGASST